MGAGEQRLLFSAAPLLATNHCPLIGPLALLLGGGEAWRFCWDLRSCRRARLVPRSRARALVSLALARNSACLARRAWLVARLSCTRAWRWARSARSVCPCLSQLHVFRVADD